MAAWEQKTFVFPEPWGLTPPKCKGSCLLSDPHHGSPHKVLGMSILKHFLLLLSRLCLATALAPVCSDPSEHPLLLLGLQEGYVDCSWGSRKGMWRAAHHLPQEVPAIRASVSHYRTTAKHSEAHSQQPAPPGVPWKLF